MDSTDRDAAPGGRPPDPRRLLGAQGEEIACRHLQRLDFTILARNVRTRHGEIDLIACDGTTLLFVEVKTRRARGSTGCLDVQSGPSGATPAVAIAPLEGLRHSQRSRLRRLATAWLQSASPRPRVAEIRFDAIGVLLDAHERLLRLDHVEGAW